jgi:signal peptidase II
VTLVADQVTKTLVVMRLAPGESHPLLPPIISLTHVQNTGAAFGLFKGQQLVFVGLSLIVIGWLIWELRAPQRLASIVRWGSALILGGASGNLIDRLRLGYVTDFIDCHVWPVFNVGDSAITIGVGLLLIQSLRGARTRQG